MSQPLRASIMVHSLHAHRCGGRHGLRVLITPTRWPTSELGSSMMRPKHNAPRLYSSTSALCPRRWCGVDQYTQGGHEHRHWQKQLQLVRLYAAHKPLFTTRALHLSPASMDSSSSGRHLQGFIMSTPNRTKSRRLSKHEHAYALGDQRRKFTS